MLKHRIAAFCFMFAISATVMAQDFFVYPKNDQDAAQQQKDESECYVWSKNQSGFDPANPPQSTAPPPADMGPDGSLARGAARGAALGAIVGNSDDARKGAAAGAAVGVMRRRDRARNDNAERERHQQQEAARLAELHDRFNRAYKGCMEARDYSIS
ncbi:MAG: hypothetical protein ACR2Q3_08775 [Woeseiaceae bacterium]